jgi:hypothetical protein
MVARGISLSVGGTVSSSDIAANCTQHECFHVLTPRSEVCVILVSDHPAVGLSAAFFKESISRPIIKGRYLWVELLS